MRYHNPHNTDTTRTIRVLSVSVFCLFSFFWLYWFQPDVLTLTQHILSNQQTIYLRLPSALIITAILWVVQALVSKVVRLRKHSYALTFFPSMLLLAIYSDVYPSEGQFYSLPWLYIAPVLLLLWGLLVWIIHQLFGYDEKNGWQEPVSRQTWINLFELCCMMLTVVLLSNTNAVQHYQARVEKSILDGDMADALSTGARSQENSTRLTMLRVLALSKEGQLAERLFEYPVSGATDSLIPLTQEARKQPLLFSMDEFYELLGARPVAINQPKRYLELLKKDSLATAAARDYQLCGLLLERDVDGFVSQLQAYYADSLPALPRYYREALVLYNHLRNQTSVDYRDSSTEEDWQNFRAMREAVASGKERHDCLHENYGASYWYYYYNNMKQ